MKKENYTIGDRVRELMDYFEFTHNKFANEIELTNSDIIKKYLTGEIIPSIATIHKILKRFPTSEEWLISGKGEMWEEDYFEKRFRVIQFGAKTTKDKMNFLLIAFEKNYAQFARKVGLSRKVILELANGTTASFSPNTRRKIIEAYPFVPDSYFD